MPGTTRLLLAFEPKSPRRNSPVRTTRCADRKCQQLTQVSLPGQLGLQGPIKLKTVAAGITKMKFSRTPRRVFGRGPGAVCITVRSNSAALNKLVIDAVDITDQEAKNRSIRGICPLLFVCPLEVQFDPIPPDDDILGLDRSVLVDHFECQTPIEPHEFVDVSRADHRVHRL